jgi:hypothetical protein
MGFRGLDAERVSRTIDALCRRVEVRFPGSGLAGICRDLDEVARRNAEITAWIARPIISLRVGVALLVVLILAGIAVTAAALRPAATPLSFSELIQTLEAGVNDVVFVAVAVFFLVTLEGRVKRRRALEAIQELRSIAHVIDMHQLTKDPESVLRRGPETGVVASRPMTRFELSRYLDYCSEALSLTGKVAALYIQGIDDPVALQAVNEVEDLTTGLSRKIWQKLMILYAMGPEA